MRDVLMNIFLIFPAVVYEFVLKQNVCFGRCTKIDLIQENILNIRLISGIKINRKIFIRDKAAININDILLLQYCRRYTYIIIFLLYFSHGK